MKLRNYNQTFPFARPHQQQGRYALLRILLNAGQNLVTITEPSSSKSDEDVIVTLDRSKILSVGLPAISDFLMKLQVYKATADFAAGQKLYDEVTTVPESWRGLRNVVLSKKQPRKVFVMANTRIVGDEVELVEYEENVRGLVRSFVERDV